MESSKVLEEGWLSPSELASLQKLVALYVQAKGLILYSEEIDPDSRSNIQVIKELRDAFDHLMRVFAARHTNIPPPGSVEQGYCQKNLEKAIGHVYRAAFDALDGTTISLKQQIAEILEPYPVEVLTEVIPNYWSRKADLNRLVLDVAKNRASKDVGGDLASTFDNYVADNNALSTFYDEIVKLGPTLDECKAQKKLSESREDKRHRKNHFFSGLGYKSVAALFALIIAFFFGQQSETWKVNAKTKIKETHQSTTDSHENMTSLPVTIQPSEKVTDKASKSKTDH